MIKFKLLEARKRRKYTQEYMAAALYMDISNYSRRENGQIKINRKEWQRLAEVLTIPLEQIYESDDEGFLKDQTMDNHTFGNNSSQNISELQKSIEKLVLEMDKLKEEIHHLKSRNRY
ncbi:helix-turn-helix domain-containing protein [Chryseobacterium sp. PMSZPI]|uniref:helix-turn-helix domain-containing protein n=1 Tax=Chryseobacterium sp. PMSZPI TaxID=1033900 RepID=UPI000C32DE68|nr:helix-turn-helix transcriptional regulator [Chryseobacterium sp. PMSZPI]PKF75519.1 XRE family transcriptional regulator [Chryseobacterium sp. PMSZPI]